MLARRQPAASPDLAISLPYRIPERAISAPESGVLTRRPE